MQRRTWRYAPGVNSDLRGAVRERKSEIRRRGNCVVRKLGARIGQRDMRGDGEARHRRDGRHRIGGGAMSDTTAWTRGGLLLRVAARGVMRTRPAMTVVRRLRRRGRRLTRMRAVHRARMQHARVAEYSGEPEREQRGEGA